MHENMPHAIKSVKESKTAFRDIPDEDKKFLRMATHKIQLRVMKVKPEFDEKLHIS